MPITITKIQRAGSDGNKILPEILRYKSQVCLIYYPFLREHITSRSPRACHYIIWTEREAKPLKKAGLRYTKDKSS